MSLSGCQINPIDANFHLQKSLKFLVKIKLTKSGPKRTGGGKSPASCQLGLSNHLGNGTNFVMTFCQISDSRICATILPIDPPENPKGMYDPQDLDSNAKDFVSGYAVEALDITSEETCLLGLKVREMKDDVRNIICSVTKTKPQKVMEKVRMCL